MGNCLFGGVIGDDEHVKEQVIRVVTSNGGIMEFFAPITVEFITEEFPGHGIFKSHDLFWKPLPLQELLQAGDHYYYLLPLELSREKDGGGIIAAGGHVRSNSVPSASQITSAPYRMSFDRQRVLMKRSQTQSAEVLLSDSSSSSSRRRSRGGGGSKSNSRFWKVKLVICPQQLLEILSEEGRTQELIESVRTVAKCGNGVSSSSAAVFSDEWSLSSTTSRNASSKKDSLLLDF
ncbi:hypothetical protein M9H77_25072 [Catharanthus roseus]|uniref:Uncharacterized protein n=1 Tax=Catharanthus roseus TaxID=4058 RepID=A0ACC0A7W9_CATRO|nr:hypothetical protein M9H77_25072 [Catharanthus roseus]